ncbi:MAG: glutamate racemase [Francisellaceae bacterium]|nr:glutamate racemase [Francisellaceae bacterium]
MNDLTSLLNSGHPIGIFDSGSGGLTVTKTITELLPFENIIYFGDTAHAPWGDKSIAAIQAYSIRICEVLLKHHCKLILIACHTASAIAYELVKEYVGDRAIVLNVVDPVINHIKQHHKNQKIGLIGTKQTVRSNIYTKRIDALNENIELSALATPLLVPLIEEGYAKKPVTQMIVADYLSQSCLQSIDAIILGCTHYPLIKDHIQNFYKNNIHIIDASTIIASLLKEKLKTQKLLNAEKDSKKIFYVSDYNEFFNKTAEIFFGSELQLEPYPLWE